MKTLKLTNYISNEPIIIDSDKIMTIESRHDYTNEGQDYTEIILQGDLKEPLMKVGVKESVDEINALIEKGNGTQ